MDREYDIFEKVDGNELWRCSVVGHEQAIARVKELASASTNAFMVMHLPSGALVATLNADKPSA